MSHNTGLQFFRIPLIYSVPLHSMAIYFSAKLWIMHNLNTFPYLVPRECPAPGRLGLRSPFAGTTSAYHNGDYPGGET